MNKMLMLCALVALALIGLTGCTSMTEVDWGGRMAVRQPDGTVLVNKDGEPFYESGKNHYRDSNWLTKREERDVAVKANPDGSYEAGLGSRSNDVSENGIKMVQGSIEATTKLVTAVGEAYAKISGGAATDVTTAVVSKVIQAFTSGGGNTEKATVTTADSTIKVSDGSICTTCDQQGNCTTGACSE